MEQEAGEKPQTAEEMLFEILEHGLLLIKEKLPQLTKDIRREAFENESLKPMAPAIVKSTFLADASVAAVTTHLKNSEMDKLRVIQPLYFMFCESGPFTKLISDIPDENTQELLNSLDTVVDDIANKTKTLIRSGLISTDRVKFIKEICSTIALFVDCANSMGGPALFLQKTPEAYTSLLGGVPKVCTIHPANQ